MRPHPDGIGATSAVGQGHEAHCHAGAGGRAPSPGGWSTAPGEAQMRGRLGRARLGTGLRAPLSPSHPLCPQGPELERHPVHPP